MAIISCPECGSGVSSQAASCPKCAYPITRSGVVISPSSGKSRSTAALLALILGGLGVHKFYVNKPGVGLLYMLFFWTFLPAIAGFIEALQYISMSDATFETKFAKGEL